MYFTSRGETIGRREIYRVHRIPQIYAVYFRRNRDGRRVYRIRRAVPLLDYADLARTIDRDSIFSRDQIENYIAKLVSFGLKI
jgi:hypothetical protein